MHSLIDTGTVARGYLGVYTDALTADMTESFGLKPDTKGVIITDINPADGPAAKAGLKREDIIVGINDKAVASRDDLRMIIAETAPDTKVVVKYIRDGKPATKEVTLGRLPDDDSTDGELVPGVTVAPLTADLRKELRIDDRVDGIVITDVGNDSVYRENFPQGAVIEQINRVPVTDLASAKRALRDGRNIALIYYRGVFRYLMFTTR
jgi:serine protease Do/serine protease DegQ